MQYPLGGLDIGDTTLQAIELFDNKFGSALFRPAADNTPYAAGLIIARQNTGPPNGKLRPFDSAAANGLETPIGVMTTAILGVAPVGSTTDIAVRFVTRGQVRRDELFVDGSPGPIDDATAGLLNGAGIQALSVEELLEFDNS